MGLDSDQIVSSQIGPLILFSSAAPSSIVGNPGLELWERSGQIVDVFVGPSCGSRVSLDSSGEIIVRESTRGNGKSSPKMGGLGLRLLCHLPRTSVKPTSHLRDGGPVRSPKAASLFVLVTIDSRPRPIRFWTSNRKPRGQGRRREVRNLGAADRLASIVGQSAHLRGRDLARAIATDRHDITRVAATRRSLSRRTISR